MPYLDATSVGKQVDPFKCLWNKILKFIFCSVGILFCQYIIFRNFDQLVRIHQKFERSLPSFVLVLFILKYEICIFFFNNRFLIIPLYFHLDVSCRSPVDRLLFTDHEITGSIRDTSTILNFNWVFKVVHPSSRRQLGSYLIEN